MSKTERALTSDEAGALDEEADETRDSTEEIWAEVDQALDEYAAEQAPADVADVDVEDVADVAAEEDVAVGDVADVAAEEDVAVGDVAVGDVAVGDVADVADEEDVEVGDAEPLPAIVPATPDDDLHVSDPVEGRGDDDAEARESEDDDAVSEDILEELRRADIDGPIVDVAPQDDTTAARRRPKRTPDYDPAPMPIPAQVPRVLGRKPRVRKVTRVVRHVDPWSVFKIALVAHLVLYVILLTAGVLLWNVAHATGTVDNVERFFESFGWDTFEFNGGEIYHAAWISGLFGVIGLTGLAVLMATLFNLITDLVGGMRFTVLEEEVVETRTSPMRRFVIRRPEPVAPARIEDASGPMIREAVVDDSGAIVRPSR